MCLHTSHACAIRYDPEIAGFGMATRYGVKGYPAILGFSRRGRGGGGPDHVVTKYEGPRTTRALTAWASSLVGVAAPPLQMRVPLGLVHTAALRTLKTRALCVVVLHFVLVRVSWKLCGSPR